MENVRNPIMMEIFEKMLSMEPLINFLRMLHENIPESVSKLKLGIYKDSKFHVVNRSLL